MVKKIILDLEIRYVANANEAVPAGEQHIFVMHKGGVLDTYSFCGMTVHEIGDETTVPQKMRDSKLPVCQKCSDGWKADPRSPWARFATGAKIR